MDLNEMHVWFRQYAQQMGMQNVRAILPEQIDIVINTSISDYVNEIIRTNIGLTNDRIITDNSKIGQINALRTLNDVAELTISSDNTGDIIPYITNLNHYRCANFIKNLNDNHNMMYYVDSSIRYYKNDNDQDLTNWYPVRTIESMFLADTLQDYILGPKFRSPICVIEGGKLDLYLGPTISGLTPANLRVTILKYPAKVQYLEDFDQDNVDCDLPAYTHVDILKHAVDLYRVAIQGSLYANQQQQQAQQREVGRNNVRPDNEGYTQ